MEKLSNSEAELEIRVAYEKKHVFLKMPDII